MEENRTQRLPHVRTGSGVAESPGTLRVPAGASDTRVSVVAYGPTDLVEEEVTDLARLEELARSHAVVWVNVVGLGNLELLTSLGERFKLHQLALEDMLSVRQRPKLDDYGEHQFIVARMPLAGTRLKTEQLSIFSGPGFVITVQERSGDCFDGIRGRIHNGRPRIREGGPDYLVYAILDALVDSYFPLLEHVSVNLERLEKKIHRDPENRHIKRLHLIKKDLVVLRRFLWPLRELTTELVRPDNNFLEDSTRVFMRDCHDHVLRALDLNDSLRDIASGLMDLYLSLTGQKMNEVMRVLTVIATIFIPLSFIAGLYGMNFDSSASRWNMPELAWAYGYPMVLGFMVLCAVGMLLVFWKKGWFR